MIQEYNLDIGEASQWLIATPRVLKETPPFMVSEAGHFYAKQGYYTERRDKADYLLIYTTAGQGLLRYRERDWALGEGTVAFIDCREYHRYQTAPGEAEDWAFYWMHLSSPYSSFYERVFHPGGFCLCHSRRGLELETHFGEVLDTIENSHLNDYCTISNAASNILSCVVGSDASARPQARPHAQAIGRAVAYIKQHYDQPLDLSELAAQVQLSKFYFLRLFKEYMQITPYRYLVYYRINESKKLLDSTDLKICRISEMVGFSDECNYIRTFKDITGQTPLQYRRG